MTPVGGSRARRPATMASRCARISALGSGWAIILASRTRLAWDCAAVPALRQGAAASALAGLHPRVLLVDDVDAAVAEHHAAVLVAALGRFQAVADLHDGGPWLRRKEARGLEARR